MESAEAPLRRRLKINYTIQVPVVQVEERFRRVYLRGHGETAEFIEHSQGWFIQFAGSWESLYFGAEQPPFKQGDTVKITFERIDDPCQASPTTNPTNSPNASSSETAKLERPEPSPAS